MSTHGNIFVVDEGCDQGTWLHAYSDGNSQEAYDMLITLPDFFASRVILDKDLPSKGLGKGWFLDQWSKKHWDNYLSVCCECYASTVSAMICNRYFIRWCPLPEDQAPWHTVGEAPDFKVVCRDSSYDIIPSQEIVLESDKTIVPLTIDFSNKLYSIINRFVNKEDFE
jgi:hypothetical protein